jgi:hypothetical protein
MRGLSQVIAEEGAGLVFLDPITSWLDSDVTGGGDVAVRALIEQLQEVAAAQSCHVLFTRHDRKGRDGSAKDRVGGSGAWTQTPRTVIRLSEDAASPGCYRMVALKGQVDGRPPSRTYTLPRVGRIPRFAAGPVIDLTGLDLEDEVVGAMARSIVTDAENMIRYALEADDRASSVMHLRAQDEGISVAALRRAFLRLKPETYRVSHEGTWKLMWRKPAGGWPTTRSAD